MSLEFSFFDIYQCKGRLRKELPMICIKIVSNYKFSSSFQWFCLARRALIGTQFSNEIFVFLVEPNPGIYNGVEDIPNEGGQHHQNGGDEE